ncbi:MAG: CRISPR system precrRNA processing endoribonuclease RAMP protein Cas6 [Bryobacteraceae bacterium]
MDFRLYPLRFSFLALETIHFPPGRSSNILRGAFGLIFRRIACVPQCTGARGCEFRATCPYRRMFEPAAIAGGPSGLGDWPRPFVFRATHLDGRTFAAGESFYFDLNLFDLDSQAVGYLVLAFTQLAREGLGSGRSRVELKSVTQLDEEGNAFVSREGMPAMQISLDTPATAIAKVRVLFRTPTELKSGQQLAPRPEFSILAARVRDRIGTLRELYGDGPLKIDFRAFGERASGVRMNRCDITQVEMVRRSSRTGLVHPIGGFVGEAEYEGDLTEFIPYLRAARWTGVGRQTVWGKGEVALECL